MDLFHSSSLYLTLLPLPWLYFTLLDCALLCHGSTSPTLLYITLLRLYFTLLYPISLYQGCTSLYVTLYFTLHHSTIAQLHQHYHTLLYHSLTSFSSTLDNSTMDLLHSTSLYFTLQYCTMALLHSTLPYLYLTPLDSTAFYHSSTSL